MGTNLITRPGAAFAQEFRRDVNALTPDAWEKLGIYNFNDPAPEDPPPGGDPPPDPTGRAFFVPTVHPHLYLPG